MATIGSLEWLVRGGRVPQAVAWAGRALHLRPVFSLNEGRVHRHRPALTSASAHERIVSACRGSGHGRLHVVGLGTGALLPATVDGLDVAEAHVMPFSAGMVAHSGPEIEGLAWWWE
jgi:fatty acid-binding protein DegV